MEEKQHQPSQPSSRNMGLGTPKEAPVEDASSQPLARNATDEDKQGRLDRHANQRSDSTQKDPHFSTGGGAVKNGIAQALNGLGAICAFISGMYWHLSTVGRVERGPQSWSDFLDGFNETAAIFAVVSAALFIGALFFKK